jgi:hypothetical protein
LSRKAKAAMGWDFFHDECEGRPYRSFQDWYDEIEHLIRPSIVAVILLTALLLCLRFLCN